MPKMVEYHTNGVREIYSRKECHSCWDCQYCVNMADSSHYICRSRGINSHKSINFPYDNTKCKEFKHRDGES